MIIQEPQKIPSAVVFVLAASNEMLSNADLLALLPLTLEQTQLNWFTGKDKSVDVQQAESAMLTGPSCLCRKETKWDDEHKAAEFRPRLSEMPPEEIRSLPMLDCKFHL